MKLPSVLLVLSIPALLLAGCSDEPRYQLIVGNDGLIAWRFDPRTGDTHVAIYNSAKWRFVADPAGPWKDFGGGDRIITPAPK